ncbi:AmmeMemoRadiSam system protein B [Candidatus Thorarchaeota archaeon]|nr:MAG: AmmeMemoRadiSam system protein B [Candidatus Thorarchaeota archaeon]
MTRMPVVAGKFYEGTEDMLLKRLRESFTGNMGPGEVPEGEPGNRRNIKALIAPHAGYVYSGMTAAHSYLDLFRDGRPSHIVIIGPNHTGQGERVAVCNDDWLTPLGEVEYDTEIGPEIIQRNQYAAPDCIAHSSEHSIEVQLPFIQYVFDAPISFVPMCMGTQNYDVCKSLGETIASLAEDDDILVIASSDFTHFESSDSARKKDNQAMEFLEFLDPEGFLNFVTSHRVSICGAAPITTALVFAKELGAIEFNLLKYSNSGDVTGDNGNVVAYVAAEFI